MAKKKAPARKGGSKKSAPKKAVKRKPIPQQVAEKAVKARMRESALPHRDVTAPTHPTVEEQFERDQRQLFMGEQLVFKPGEGAEVFGAALVSKRSLLRRALDGAKRLFRFRSAKTGEFVTKAEAEASPETTVRERVE